MIAGCISCPESGASMAYRIGDREAWIHELSYAQYSLSEWAQAKTARRVLAGYDVARVQASLGLQQHPRPKDTEIMTRYYEEFGND